MSKDYNKMKSEHLGMNASTAQHQLRKKILFSLLKKLNENFCFQCGAEIESEETLSIEHKTPWLHGDVSLFWDLDNIAFSHLKCNIGAARKPESYPDRKDVPLNVGPDGTHWCYKCQQFLPSHLFSKNSTKCRGLQKECKQCRYDIKRAAAEKSPSNTIYAVK